MHGRPASRQPSPNRAIVVIVGRGGESSPNPPLTRVGPKALPGSRTGLTSIANIDTYLRGLTPNATSGYVNVLDDLRTF